MEKFLCRQNRFFPKLRKTTVYLLKPAVLKSSPSMVRRKGYTSGQNFEACFMLGVFLKSLFIFFKDARSTMFVLKTINSTGG